MRDRTSVSLQSWPAIALALPFLACADPGSRHDASDTDSGEETEGDSGISDIPEGCRPGADEVVILDDTIITDGTDRVTLPRSPKPSDRESSYEVIWREKGEWQARPLEEEAGCRRATGVTAERFWTRSINYDAELDRRRSSYVAYETRLIDRRSLVYAALDAVHYASTDEADEDAPFVEVGLPEGSQASIEEGSSLSHSVLCPQYGATWGDLLGGSRWSDTQSDTLELSAPRFSSPKASLGDCLAVVEEEQLREEDGWQHQLLAPFAMADLGAISGKTGRVSFTEADTQTIPTEPFTINWQIDAARRALVGDDPELEMAGVSSWLSRDVPLTEDRSGLLALEGWFYSSEIEAGEGALGSYDYALPQLELEGESRVSNSYRFETVDEGNIGDPTKPWVAVGSTAPLSVVSPGAELTPSIQVRPSELRVGGRSVRFKRPELEGPFSVEIDVAEASPTYYTLRMYRQYRDPESDSWQTEYEYVSVYARRPEIELPEVFEGQRGSQTFDARVYYCPNADARYGDERCGMGQLYVLHPQPMDAPHQRPTIDESLRSLDNAAPYGPRP